MQHQSAWFPLTARSISTNQFNFLQCLHKLIESTKVLFEIPIRFWETTKKCECCKEANIKELQLKIDRNELSRSRHRVLCKLHRDNLSPAQWRDKTSLTHISICHCPPSEYTNNTGLFKAWWDKSAASFPACHMEDEGSKTLSLYVTWTSPLYHDPDKLSCHLIHSATCYYVIFHRMGIGIEISTG